MQPPYGYYPQPNPYYPPLPPHPGCIPLRPLTLGDILDGTFKVVRRNPRVILGLSAVFAIATVLVGAVFQVVALNQIRDIRVATESGTTASTSLIPLLSGAFTVFVAGAVLQAILTGMLTAVVTQDVLGVRLTAGQVWDRVRGRIWPLIGLSLLTTVVADLALFACVAPGIWLWGIWAVAVPAFVVERTTVRTALRRSRDLVRGTFWRVWGIRALGFLMVSFVGSIVGLPFTLLALAVTGSDAGLFGTGTGDVPALYLVMTSIGSIVTGTFTAPIRAGIDALLYVDLRMRKEGMDIVLQQEFTRRAAPVQSGPMPPMPPRSAF